MEKLNENLNLIQFRTDKPHEKIEYASFAQELDMTLSEYCRVALRAYTNMRKAARQNRQNKQERAAS